MNTDAKENTEFTSGLNHVSAEGRQHGMEFGYVKQAGKGRAPGQLLLAVGVSTGTRLRGCDLLRYSLATLFAHFIQQRQLAKKCSIRARLSNKR